MFFPVRLVYALSFVLLYSHSCRAGVLDDLRNDKPLKVCIWPDYFGISYRNPRIDKYQGIDIELSAAFAKELGVGLDYVETNFGQFIEDIETGKCHIAMMGVGVTPERREHVNFSEPYLRSDVFAIETRANTLVRTWDDIDRPQRVVVVQKGTYMEPLMRNVLKQADLRVVDKPGEREIEIKSGRADVFITDYPYSRLMLEKYDWVRVIAPSRPVNPTDYAYAVAKGDAAWLDRVNQFVNRIKKDGRLLAAARPFNLESIIVTE